MFDIFKRKKKQAEPSQTEAEITETEAPIKAEGDAIVKTVVDTGIESAQAPETAAPQEMLKAGEPASEDTVFFQEEEDTSSEQPAEKKKGFFSRLATGLSKTRSGFSDGVANLLLGKKEIDDDLLEDLETQLIMADVGVEATREIRAKLTERVGRKELTDSDALFEALIKELQDILAPCQQPLVIDSSDKPYVILMVGINGVGKTTTIGKLAKQFQAKGKSVMLAAGDTFRAAAVEQLQVWGERNDVAVVAQHTGADSASVLYDALEAATARGTDILIADTAGRLHTKDNLMGELEKVVRVMKKLDPDAPHEVMLVLDAGTGQNALNQAAQFQKSVGVTGLTLTKLDGTAKGGVIFALAKQLGLPVRFIGIGEGINDLRPFDANDFTRALFNKEN
jgi:fused signal recognition particle receptor